MRKIVQITNRLSYIVALCDDGTVWKTGNDKDWKQIPTPFTEEPAKDKGEADPCNKCEPQEHCKTHPCFDKLEFDKKQAYDQRKGR